MLKFKVGDKILIKSEKKLLKEFFLDSDGDIKRSSITSGIFFANSMLKFCEKTLTVEEVDIDDDPDSMGYKVVEDDEGYVFCDWMIEEDPMMKVIFKIKKEIGL